jgi:4-aminobutyrate aminotransferase/(S)-3-amino-2-methylpropionate transaminase
MGKVIKYCQQNGVLILSAGTYSNVIRLLPPLVISEDLLREGLKILDDAFAAL